MENYKKKTQFLLQGYHTTKAVSCLTSSVSHSIRLIIVYVLALNMFPMHVSPEATYGPDFRFPDAWGGNDYRLEDGIKRDNIEPSLLLRGDIHNDYSSYSPPMWKTCPSKSDVQPLLPLQHPCSNLSPRAMTQAIANSREEMMKMIRDLPESSYELSLKDIVDLRISQDAKVESPTEDEPGFFLTPQRVKPKKKMSNIRSDSMDNSAFLIKTFFPSFSISKRKLAPGNISRIIPRSSSILGSQRSNDKKHWIDKPVKETAELPMNSINNFRHEDDKHETGCWPSFSGMKTRKWRKNGCLF